MPGVDIQDAAELAGGAGPQLSDPEWIRDGGKAALAGAEVVPAGSCRERDQQDERAGYPTGVQETDVGGGAEHAVGSNVECMYSSVVLYMSDMACPWPMGGRTAMLRV